VLAKILKAKTGFAGGKKTDFQLRSI